MPGKRYASIQNPAQYRALRRQGMSKRRAAMISNGVTSGHTVKASATAPAVTPPHGPGGLLTTPGLGPTSRRWGRRKAAPPEQVRTKALPAPTRQLDAGHTGVMIALMVPPALAQRIAALDGVTEPAEQLHLTLAFLGDSTERPLASNDARVLAAVRDWAVRQVPLAGTINGVGRFLNAESDGTNAVYLAPDLPTLPALRQSLVAAIEAAGFDYAQNHGFTPHITVAYVPEDAPTPMIRFAAPLRFDRVTLAWGDAHYDLPLGTGARTKANYGARAGQVIAGNLARGGDGKFTSAGAATPAKGTTPARRPTSRPLPAGRRRATRGSAPKAPKAPTAAQQQRERERQADRQTRIDRQTQRDAERQTDRAQRQQDRITRQQERMADRAQRQADRERKLAQALAKKPTGGGKAPTATPTEAERRQQQQTERAQTARDTAAGLPAASQIAAGDVDALRLAAGQGGVSSARLRQLGLVGDDGMATDQGRRALTALELGKPAQYLAAVQDAAGRMDRARQAGERRTAAEASAQRRQQETARRQAEALTRRAAQAARVRGARLKVYKDAAGALRWVAHSTTAYRDRDGEILSEAALDADSQRMTATRQYGPLRYWHLGQPDPTDADAPWGPGVDLGDCDFSMQIGRTRVESGTFRDPAVARRIAAAADGYELSPGFFHPPTEPGAGGVFGQIHTFERSLVPTAYGRASNLFTGLTVKETTRMDPKEEQRRLEIAAKALGIPPAELAAGLARTDKSAADQQVAFKDAGLAVYELDGQPYVVRDGQLVALKAAMPAEEMIAAGETEVEDGAADAAEDAAEAEDVSEFIGDLSPSDFRALLRDEFAAAVQAMGAEIAGKMAAMDEQLKGMGYARAKEAGDAAKVADRVAALETQLKAARAELAGLSDDSAAGAQRRGFRPSEGGHDVPADVAAKLKADQQPAALRTGDAAVDSVAQWLAPDGSLPPIPGLGMALGTAQLFGINGAAPAGAGEE